MTRYLRPVAAAVLGAAVLLGPGAVIGATAALAANCGAPLDAAMKLNDTSYHMKMTTTDASGSNPVESELISTDDATYVRIDGTWTPGPRETLTLGDLEDMSEAEQYMTCKLVRSEQVGGRMTDVWQIDDQSDPDELKQQTVWIAKDSGRIIQMEVEIRDGESVSMRMAAQLDYENVLPPR